MPPASAPDPALGVVIRRLREDRKMRQEDLAYKAKIRTGTLSKIELGQANPTWGTVRQLARALRVSLTDLGKAVEDESER